MQNTAIIIQTCDKYEFLWQGWFYYFYKYWDYSIQCPIFFCSEERDLLVFPTPLPEPHCYSVSSIKTGKGQWGERLHRILDALPENIDTVFYMQEDFWLHRTLPKHIFESRLKTFREWDMDAYRCCANSKHFKFVGKHSPRHYAPDSPYLITHQASFWKRDYFRSVVLPHEDPWQNEKMGSRRVQGQHKIFFAPFNFYHTVCRKGELTDIGRELDAEAKNSTD